MTRVAVIGSTGQLGSDLVKIFRAAESYTVAPLTRAEIECTEPASVNQVLRRVRPEIVVNCAGFVRVDECEDHPDEAFSVNATGALNVARVCQEIGALCVYVSTDYVFDGEKGSSYAEDESPRPINVYGTSKIAGEYLVQQSCHDWLVVRMASLFGKEGSRGKTGNFVDTIVKRAQRGEFIQVVDDIRMSPTYTYDAARALENLVRARVSGVVHLTNAGSCTWYEFARTALELLGLQARLEPVSSKEYPLRARRPRDSSLRSLRFSSLTADAMRAWQDALKAHLIEKGYM